MAVQVSDISALVRNLVLDFSKNQVPGDVYTYGSSNVFTLSEPNATAITAVLINGTSSALYTYSNSTQKVTVTATLSVGDTVEIQYAYYPNYSDTELEAYVRSAVVHLSVNNYYTFDVDVNDEFWPEPTTRETNLIAFISSILIKPDNMTIRLPDMTINVPNTSLPTRDIISKAVRIFKHSTTGVFDVVGFGSAFPTTYYYYFR